MKFLKHLRKVNYKLNNVSKGFTLIELLAVIAILAILIIIAVPTVLKIFKEAKKNAFITQAQNVLKAAEQQYMADSITGNGETNITYSSEGEKLKLSGTGNLSYEIQFNNGVITFFKLNQEDYCMYLDIEELELDKIKIDDIKSENLDETNKKCIPDTTPPDVSGIMIDMTCPGSRPLPGAICTITRTGDAIDDVGLAENPYIYEGLTPSEIYGGVNWGVKCINNINSCANFNSGNDDGIFRYRVCAIDLAGNKSCTPYGELIIKHDWS